MNKEFIPYEQSSELKELGFKETTFKSYCKDDNLLYDITPINDNFIGAPLYQQSFRWFREKHGIVFYLNMVGINLYYYVIGTEPFLSFNTYEEAELACLKKLIYLVKNK